MRDKVFTRTVRWWVVNGLVVALITGLLLFALLRPFASPQPINRPVVPEQAAPAPRVPPAVPEEQAQRPLVTRMLEQIRAGEPVDTLDSPLAGAPAALIPVATDRRTSLGRVEVPSIGLTTPYFSGVHDEVLERGPGHWPGTPLPGQRGNAVLSGHRTTHTRPFGDLDQLEPGDPVSVNVGRKSPVTYRVTRTVVVPEDDYAEFVLGQPGQPNERSITLFACHPKGSRTHRIVVQARA